MPESLWKPSPSDLPPPARVSPVSPRAAARLGTAQIGSAPGDAARPGQHGSAQLGVTKVRFSRTLLR